MASQSQVITVSVDTAEPLPIINLTIQTFGETVKLIWVSSPSRDVKISDSAGRNSCARW